MGFSSITGIAILFITVFIVMELVAVDVIPDISNINNSLKDLKDRRVDKFQTNITINNISEINWYDNKWEIRRKILIDHDKISDDLYNFPVLIKIFDDESLGLNVQYSDGSDIFFTCSENTNKLNHQIEYFKITGGTADLIAWVNATYISSTEDTLIYMYYNATSISNQENPSGVWNKNFRAVYHLNESGPLNNRSDSTIYNEDLAPAGDILALRTGQIDGSDDFDGDGDKLTTNCSDIGKNFTVSLWAIAETTNQGGQNKGLYSSDDINTFETFQIDTDGSNPDNYRFKGGSGINSINLNIGPVSTTKWYYIVATKNINTVTVYLNGEKVVSSSSWLSDSTIYFNRIGVNRGGAAFFNGSIDEVRISDIARSADWIKTSFVNQNSPEDFITLKDPEVKTDFDLKINIKNSGSNTFNLSQLNVFVNGEKVNYTYLKPYLYSKFDTNLYIVTTSGNKKIKIVTNNAVYDKKQY